MTKTKTKNKTQSRVKRAPQGAKTPKEDIKAIVSQMAKAAIKSQTRGYQNSSSVLGNLGMMAGNGISKIFGLGAYKLEKNSLFDNHTGTQVPFMHSTDQSVTLRHREYIGEITSSIGYSANQYQINPGLSTSFPYLSTIASCFQEYKFKGLVYQFKSTGATSLVSGANTAMGNVMMVAQYRADAPVPTSKVELLNEMWATDCKTSEDCILPIECAPRENPMSVQYIRTGPPTGDIKLFDLCTLTVATQGSQGANIVGELWASYEIEFYKPKVSPTGGVLSAGHWRAAGGVGGSQFGTSSSITLVNDTTGFIITSAGITIPAGTSGRFLVQTVYYGGAVNFNPGTRGFPTNVQFLPIYNGSTRATTPTPAILSTDCSDVSIFNIDPVSTSTTISYGSGVYPTGGVVEIIVAELADTLA